MSEPCQKGDLISGTPSFTSLRCIMIFENFLAYQVYRICRRVDLRTHVSFTRVRIPIYLFEFGMFYVTTHYISGVAVHKGRSYVFELNSTFSLDSGSAGNETRYINHSSTPNCSCIGTSFFFFFLWYWDSTPFLVMLVNGEHRIGIYACTYTLHSKKKH